MNNKFNEESIKMLSTIKAMIMMDPHDHTNKTDAVDAGIAAIQNMIKLQRLVTMYAQEGHAPTRTISMEELKEFIS